MNISPSTLLRYTVEHYLWDGVGKTSEHKREFLCDAVGRAAHALLPDELICASVGEVRERIQKKIAPNITLGGWFITQGYGETNVRNPVKMQAYRRQWALELADEFEREGK